MAASITTTPPSPLNIFVYWKRNNAMTKRIYVYRAYVKENLNELYIFQLYRVIQVMYIGCCYYLMVGKFLYSALAIKLRSSLSGSKKLCSLGLRSYFLMTVGGM